jgi:hypothetical protein
MEQTVLRKNTLLFLSENIKAPGKFPNDIDKGVNFLLCPSCFWLLHVFLQTLPLQGVPPVLKEI